MSGLRHSGSAPLPAGPSAHSMDGGGGGGAGGGVGPSGGSAVSAYTRLTDSESPRNLSGHPYHHSHNNSLPRFYGDDDDLDGDSDTEAWGAQPKRKKGWWRRITRWGAEREEETRQSALLTLIPLTGGVIWALVT